MKTANIIKNIGNYVPKSDDVLSNITTSFMEIPFSNIIIDDNIRSVYDENSINELAISIKEYGLLNPLTVVRRNYTAAFY